MCHVAWYKERFWDWVTVAMAVQRKSYVFQQSVRKSQRERECVCVCERERERERERGRGRDWWLTCIQKRKLWLLRYLVGVISKSCTVSSLWGWTPSHRLLQLQHWPLRSLQQQHQMTRWKTSHCLTVSISWCVCSLLSSPQREWRYSHRLR